MPTGVNPPAAGIGTALPFTFTAPIDRDTIPKCLVASPLPATVLPITTEPMLEKLGPAITAEAAFPKIGNKAF